MITPLQLALYTDACPWLPHRHRAPGYEEYVRYHFRTGGEVYDFLRGRPFHHMDGLELVRARKGKRHASWHLLVLDEGVQVRLGTLHAYDIGALPGVGRIRHPLLAYSYE